MEDPSAPVRLKKQPLFQNEQADSQFDTLLRSGRFNSADVAKDVEKRRRKRSGKAKSKKNSSRSKSVGESAQFMSPLAAEKLDVLSTPLSSLRSCSEYNRGNTAQGFIPKAVENEVRRGFWSTLFFWSSDYDKKKGGPLDATKKKQQRVRFRSRDSEEASFLVERLRFNEANLMTGEHYNYRESTPSFSGTPHPQQNRRRHRSTSSDGSWQEDSPYDYFFGVKLASTTKFPMEIELKTIRIEYFSVYTEPVTTSAEAVLLSRNNSLTGAHNAPVALDNAPRSAAVSRSSSRMQLHDPAQSNLSIEVSRPTDEEFFDEAVDIEESRAEAAALSPVPTPSASFSSMRRVTSFRTLERLPAPPGVRSGAATPTPTLTSPPPSILAHREAETWWTRSRRAWLERWAALMAQLRQVTAAPPSEAGVALNDPFYELLRMQPFTCGGYLRGMLLAGLSSTIFQLYNVLTWPVLLRPLAAGSSWVSLSLLVMVLVQIALNVLNFPWRLQIHFLCWEASRSVEPEHAMDMIRSMLASDAWLLNRVMGTTIDCVSLVNLVVTEAFLCTAATSAGPETLALRSLVISLCATNMLTLVSRLVVAVTYAWSLHDPHVISEVRRRGLSKFDVDALPTLVFAARDDASTEDCAICLSTFELGEMLIALPCDRIHQHCFHAQCIRTWLTRQNSCPLCQRIV